MERLEQSESLRVAREEAEGAVDVGCLRGRERGQEWEEGEESEQDGGPQDERDDVVPEQVELCWVAGGG